MAQIIGVVLTGGAGRRIGRTKGDLVLNGRTLADRAAAALRPVCGSVLISIPPGGKNPAPSYPSVEDAPPPGRGPLAGIAAAYGATGRADLFVLACDYPAAGTPLLRAILTAAADEDDLVMPVDPAGRDHPLVALWRRRCESVVREALGENRLKVASLFPDFAIRRLHLDALPGEDGGRALVNVNWPEDLAAFDLH